MLLKTNWQNLGHGAVGVYGLLLSLGLDVCQGGGVRWGRQSREKGIREKGVSAGGGATKIISIKNLPTNWIFNPLKHLVF